MIEFFHQIVQPCMLPYTGLLVLMLLFWGLAFATGIDLDGGLDGVDGALDGVDGALDGVDGALDGVDGALDGVDGALDGVDGALDGADGALDGVDGALDGADGALDGADGALDGAESAVDHADVAHAAVSSPSVFGSVLSLLSFGKIPASIIFSVLVIVMWVLAYLYNFCLRPLFGDFAMPVAIVVGVVAFGVIFAVSIFISSLVLKPLAKAFEDEGQRGQQHLIGKSCVVTSSVVEAGFGEAEVAGETGPLLLSVRCAEENGLSKGDEALILGYNKERNTYQVRPLDLT
jgi:hypothetical protein